jgi:hypothetical protein
MAVRRFILHQTAILQAPQGAVNFMVRYNGESCDLDSGGRELLRLVSVLKMLPCGLVWVKDSLSSRRSIRASSDAMLGKETNIQLTLNGGRSRLFGRQQQG